jgi:arabinose-5-phosphate isomerase
MSIENFLPVARRKLCCIEQDAALMQAARLLEREHEILLVCDGDGRMAGVVTRSDVVRRIGVCSGASCTAPLSHAMTREVITASPQDDLMKAWQVMQDRRLKNIPVIDCDRRPLGVLNARDVLERLWGGIPHEEELLFNYVMNIGYR